MISLTTTLLHGLLICIPFSIFVMITFVGWPRLWLHSLPPDIIKRAAPKTDQEKRITNYVLLPIYLVILPGLSVLSVIYMAKTSLHELSWVATLVHLYAIWIIVHAWDLIVIDGIAMLLIDPAHPPISGTEGASGWKDVRFHFRSFLKAIIMSAIFVVPAATILFLIL
ncbi:hypothetical protein [Chryseolinea sp. H1M3-3]|uniref:hypothetical protein n=1 Tax=Chryseolinea sp. H1M3-3 TaxID=3034144 RepID=UPI0023EC5FD2|nr:hypothetical protein [Chryseolinea sp. H1M3-3]